MADMINEVTTNVTTEATEVAEVIDGVCNEIAVANNTEVIPKMGFFNKIGAWIGKHKKGIAIGGAVAGVAGVATYIGVKKLRDNDVVEDYDYDDEEDDESDDEE